MTATTSTRKPRSRKAAAPVVETVTPVAAEAPSWGTVKAHGLTAGQAFLYYGDDRKAPSSTVTEMVLKLDRNMYVGLGGVATRFWAAPIAIDEPAAEVVVEAEAEVVEAVPAPRTRKAQPQNEQVSTDKAVTSLTEVLAKWIERNVPGYDEPLARVAVDTAAIAVLRQAVGRLSADRVEQVTAAKAAGTSYGTMARAAGMTIGRMAAIGTGRGAYVRKGDREV